MSLTRKLFATGLPAAGVTAFAALALTGQPASAAAPLRTAVLAQEGCVADLLCDTTTDGTAGETRGGADYYGGETPGTGNGDNGPTRGNDNYGGGSTTPPGTDNTPPGTDNTPPGTDNVPPKGVSPDEVPLGGVSPGRAGGDTLPLTGSPTLLVGGLGGALVLAGGVAIYLVRRRRAA